MNNVMLNSATMGVVISLMGFFVGILCREKFKLPIFNPLLIAIIFTIIFVKIFHVDYDSNYSSAKYLSWLLTPATVALAVPLYKEVERLKSNWKMITISIACGCASSVITVLILALFSFQPRTIRYFLTKINYYCNRYGYRRGIGWYRTSNSCSYHRNRYLWRNHRRYCLQGFPYHRPNCSRLSSWS